jgi:glycine/D-amino acid oxidase-like deaminating enzyme
VAERRSVIIVGAGAFGASAALELRRRGFDVRLVDPGPLPHPEASSTDISKAVRMDYGADELYTGLALEALRGWDAWSHEWKRPLYHEVGFLLMRGEPMAPGQFEHDGFELLSRMGQPVERMDAPRLAECAPAWSAQRYVDGYYNPRGGWAASGAVVGWLIEQAAAAGVELHEGKRFAGLCERGSRVGGIVTADGETLVADRVVVAAGAWTPALLPQLFDAMWVVGQPALHFRPDDPGPYLGERFPVWCADLATTGWYGFPCNDGVVKVANHGPGRPMHPDDPKVVDPAEEERFREFLRGTFPGLADAPLATSRLCLYCDTWDGNFWIDHDPAREGLIVACGGSGHGFKFTPVLGEIIADVVERKPNPWAPRFAWREPGERKTEQARQGAH